VDEKLFDDLAQVLRQEMDCYERALDLLRGEKGLLIKGDLEALGEQVKQKETLGLEVKVLEEARLGLMRKIGALVELPERELTCSKLAELAPPCCTPQYQALLARFKQLIGQVATVNEQSGLLLESSSIGGAATVIQPGIVDFLR
jgi:hypothetical protein